MKRSRKQDKLALSGQDLAKKKKKFFKALEEQNREQVIKMLQCDGALSNSVYQRETALMLAVNENTKEPTSTLREIVKDLLEYGADVHAKDDSNDNIMHFAMRLGCDLAMVKLLLDRGADLDVKGFDGLTPFYLATIIGNLEMVRFLCRQNMKASISVPRDSGETPLHSAVKHWKGSLIRTLLHHGADANVQDEKGNIPLHMTGLISRLFDRETRMQLLLDRETTMQFLLRRTTKLSITNKEGRTPLHTAVVRNDAYLVRLLLERSVDASGKDYNGDTPLHLAARALPTKVGLRSDDGELTNFELRALIFDLLLEQDDVDVNVKNNFGDTPLLKLLANQGMYHILEKATMLLSKGADVNAANREGTTSLHLACGRADPSQEVLQLVLAYPNVNCHDINGNTPLHLACFRNSPSLVQLLLDSGANTTFTNNLGNTPLHETFTSMSSLVGPITACVMLLLHRGADCTIPNQKGDTPFLLACNTRQLDLIYCMVRCSPHHLRPRLRRTSAEEAWRKLAREGKRQRDS